MKKLVRFLAFFCAVTLLFSCFFTGSASDNDARFDNYINMGDAAVQNNFEIPNLFRQNAVFSNQTRFPLVVKNGVEYVPLSMFILYPNVDVTYSNTDDNFFLQNTKNDRYISFNVQKGVASTYDGDLLKMEVPIFNRTRYIPARTVAVVLGFTCESYDNKEKGIYAFRVSDGKSGKTLEQLIAPYIEAYTEKSTKPEPPPPPPPVQVQDDPLEKIAKRRVAICYSNVEAAETRRVLDSLRSYGIKASFSVTASDILERTDLVREMFVSGHSLVLTAEAVGKTPEQYAESFVDGLNGANEALKSVLKRKTRMCSLPFDLPEDIRNDKTFISLVEKEGYVVLLPNTETGDGPEYSGSAYSVSGKIKNKITGGFEEDTEAAVTALVWCSDKTPYYTADIANFVKKYPQHEFYAMDEAFIINSRGE